jgi:hypothetical protein
MVSLTRLAYAPTLTTISEHALSIESYIPVEIEYLCFHNKVACKLCDDDKLPIFI